MKVYMDPQKKQKLKRLLRQLLEKEKIHIKDLARAIGLLVSTREAIAPFLLHVRFLEIEKIKALHSEGWQASVSLGTAARTELLMWLKWIEHWDGKDFGPQSAPTHTLFFDSSDHRFGFLIDGVPQTGEWSQEESRLHINAKEILALERALLAVNFSGRILVQGDNAVANIYAARGGTHSIFLLEVAKRIHTICMEKKIQLEI